MERGGERGQTRALRLPDLATGLEGEGEGFPPKQGKSAQLRVAPAGPTFVFGGGDPPGRGMEVSVLETV